jgi:hypothetical protein
MGRLPADSKLVLVPFGLDGLGNESFPRGDDRRLRGGGFQPLANRPELGLQFGKCQEQDGQVAPIGPGFRCRAPVLEGDKLAGDQFSQVLKP